MHTPKRPPRSTPSEASGRVKAVRRPWIKREWEASDVGLDIRLPDARYVVPHDTLLEWVALTSNACATASWLEKGQYHWPRPSRAMRAFLDHFRVPPAG